jgi:ABC-type multidrug transport system fused ATPase/permease subunit
MDLRFSIFREYMTLWRVSARGNKRSLMLLLILGICAVTLEVCSLSLINLFFYSGSGSIPNESYAKGFVLAALKPQGNFGWIVVSVITITFIAKVAATWQQSRTGARLITTLCNQVFSAAIGRSYRWHIETSSSEVLSALTRDSDNVFESIKNILNLIVNIPLMAGIVLFLCAINISNAWFIIGIAIFYAAIYNLMKNRLISLGSLLSISSQETIKTVQESLDSIRAIKIDHLEESALLRFSKHNTRARNAAAELGFMGTLPRMTSESFLMAAIISWCSYKLISNGNFAAQLQELATLTVALIRIIYPAQIIFNSLASLKSCKQSAKRLNNVISCEQKSQLCPANISKLHAQTLKTFEKATSNQGDFEYLVTLSDVSYQYSTKERIVISDLNYSFEEGLRYGIIGSSGSGKSTLLSLITGLLEPTKGVVTRNGYDINNITKHDRKKIDLLMSYAPQSVFLSDDTIYNNITFGLQKNDADILWFQQVLKLVDLHDYVNSLPLKDDTCVGERGMMLSGGQAQRIGIARALFKKPAVLILDESTSSLDNRTERTVMKNIYSLSGLTIIMVSHKYDVLYGCDEIIELSMGRIKKRLSYLQLQERSDHSRNQSD